VVGGDGASIGIETVDFETVGDVGGSGFLGGSMDEEGTNEVAAWNVGDVGVLTIVSMLGTGDRVPPYLDPFLWGLMPVSLTADRRSARPRSLLSVLSAPSFLGRTSLHPWAYTEYMPFPVEASP
jgi:hypothetical protein